MWKRNRCTTDYSSIYKLISFNILQYISLWVYTKVGNRKSTFSKRIIHELKTKQLSMNSHIVILSFGLYRGRNIESIHFRKQKTKKNNPLLIDIFDIFYTKIILCTVYISPTAPINNIIINHVVEAEHEVKEKPLASFFILLEDVCWLPSDLLISAKDLQLSNCHSGNIIF